MTTAEQLLSWLGEEAPERMEELRREADRTRAEVVGDEVHLRGLIELSNRCQRSCLYCGLRAARRDLPRYRMSGLEVLRCARLAATLGCGTVVLQAGEDLSLSIEWLSRLIREIKGSLGVAVTLSLGELPLASYEGLRRAGADRVLLRFETSNRTLYERLHPPRPGEPVVDRVELLRELRGLGYEVGGGVIIGLPGQTLGSVADDLLLCRELDLDMVALGPYVAHPATPLGRHPPEAAVGQAPASAELTRRALCLARRLCPEANIPSTRALFEVDAGSHTGGLQSGANVVMINVTPPAEQRLYEIYPTREILDPVEVRASLVSSFERLGRVPGRGTGPRRLASAASMSLR